MKSECLFYSIRTQANIQLLDEKINLIGSLKAHREHCQHLESTLQNLEIQASNLPQVPSEMINTIQELKKDVLYTFQFPTTSTAPTDENNSEVEFHSESDLSCCDGGQDDHPGGDNVEVEEKISNISSSHSMSRYGSESPLRSLLQLVSTYIEYLPLFRQIICKSYFPHHGSSIAVLPADDLVD